MALPAIQELDLHNQNAKVALECFARCGASELIELRDGEKTAHWAGFDGVEIKDALWERRIDCFSALLAQRPSAEPICVRDRRVNVDKRCGGQTEISLQILVLPLVFGILRKLTVRLIFQPGACSKSTVSPAFQPCFASTASRFVVLTSK